MDKDLWIGELWDEWLNYEVDSQASADLEVSGILLGMRRNTTNRLRTARRFMKLWPFTSYNERLNFTPGISLTTSKNHKPSVKISCHHELLKLPKRTLRDSWAWLKGMWGSSGGLYFPKNGYHLAIINSDCQVTKILRKAINLTGLSWSEHRNEFTLRNHDDIMTFLCNTGMSESALKLIDLSLIRSQRNRANLVRNYEAANIARSIKAAREQTILAQKILSSGKLDILPENLQIIVKLRLDNPDDSLSEIGKKLHFPISKSAVKYRWEKIQKFYTEELS